MIEFLKKIALQDNFICDRCGVPDLLLGMYENCFSCKSSLIRKAIKPHDRVRLYSAKVLNKFINDYDEFINKPSDIDTNSYFISRQVKSLLTHYKKIGGSKIGGYLKLNDNEVVLSIDENYTGDHYERTITLLSVSAALKNIIEFEPPKEAYNIYSKELLDAVMLGDNINHLKKGLLAGYIKGLCDELNKNHFYHELRFDGKLIRSEFEVNEDNPEETFLGQITDNIKAIQFLKDKKLIRKDICHFCGESINKEQFTFTEPTNNFSFSICNKCYTNNSF